jgi:hypothetical protein
MSQKVPGKRYGIFVLAIVVLLLGGVAFVMGSNSFTVRVLGALACMFSVYLVQVSNVHRRSVSVLTGDSKSTMRPGALMWSIGGLLLGGAVVSYLYVYTHREVPALYVFAAVAAVCILFWSYLITTLLRGG